MNQDRDALDVRLGDEDPLALFRQMAAPKVGDADLVAMKSRVADLRRARALSQDPQYAWAFNEPKSRGWVGWRGAAVLGLLLLPAVLLQGPSPQGWTSSGLGIAVQAELPNAINTVAINAGAINAGAINTAVAAALPLVEDLEFSSGEVLQFEGDDLSVVVLH